LYIAAAAMMKLIQKEISIFNRKIPLIILFWFAVAFIAILSEVLRYSINNYLIFKQVFWHVINQKNLFNNYPAEYQDANHYGPLFSFIIAPFAVLPTWLGCIFWGLANATILLLSIRKLNISRQKQLIIIAITAIEMMTAIHNEQFNPMIGAWIILAYVLVEDEKDFWATLFIAAGFLTKIYGIGALLFFVFSKHKMRFALSFIFWLILLFILPMLYSSPQYIISCYRQWFDSLVSKNDQNIGGYNSAGFQDISVMGMIRRITNNPAFKNMYVLLPAALIIVAPLIRLKQYAHKNFRLSYLAIVLLSVVIFSSSAESSTYVIAVCGVAIWYILHYTKNTKWVNALLILLFLLTILSPTDLYPAYIKNNIIRAYSLKALPCFIVWVLLIADVSLKSFNGKPAIDN
jgi:hypothetical protein